MGLTMRERQSLVRENVSRYQTASKRQKKTFLAEFVHSTGYHRTYASYLLSHIDQHSTKSVRFDDVVILER